MLRDLEFCGLLARLCDGIDLRLRGLGAGLGSSLLLAERLAGQLLVAVQQLDNVLELLRALLRCRRVRDGAGLGHVSGRLARVGAGVLVGILAGGRLVFVLGRLVDR